MLTAFHSIRILHMTALVAHRL